MKVLFVSPFVPYPLNRGTCQRVFHFIKAAGRRFDTTLLCFSNPGDEQYLPVLESLCQRVVLLPLEKNEWRGLARRLFDPRPDTMNHWYNPQVGFCIKSILAREHFDLIHCEDICTTQYFLDMNLRIPVITDRNRVDYEFLGSRLQYLEHYREKINSLENLFKIAQFERRILERFPNQIVCSPDDRAFLRSQFGSRPHFSVIRNGIDAHCFSPMPKPESRYIELVFTGAMDYLPNHDGMMWFIAHVWPKLRQTGLPFRLTIAGLNPRDELRSAAADPTIEITGGVDDIRPYYARADLYLCPIRLGGGTRLKLVEAMAMGKCCISTTIGAQGLDLRDGIHLAYADDPESFAASIITLSQQRALRDRLAHQGQAFVNEHYTWNQLGEHFCATLQNLREESLS